MDNPNKPVNPNNPVPTPYDKRIKVLQRKIHKKSGPNDRLRNKLTRLKINQFRDVQNTPQQIPWSAAAETAYGNATRDYNTATTGIAAQQAQSKIEYGNVADPLGAQDNPYSRASLLAQAYLRNKQNTLNTYAGRGQLYAGSTQNAANYDTSNFYQGADALQRAYQGQQAGFTQAQLEAKTAETDAYQQAYVQALQDALNSRPEGAPALPGYIKKFYKQKIQRAEAHHHKGKAKHLKKKYQQLANPNPMPPTVAPKP